MPNCSRKTITEVAQPPQLQLHPIPAAFAAGIVSAAANAGPGQVFVPAHAEIHFCNHDRPGIGCVRGVAQAAIFSAICDRDAVVARDSRSAIAPRFSPHGFLERGRAPGNFLRSFAQISLCDAQTEALAKNIFQGARALMAAPDRVDTRQMQDACARHACRGNAKRMLKNAAFFYDR